ENSAAVLEKAAEAFDESPPWTQYQVAGRVVQAAKLMPPVGYMTGSDPDHEKLKKDLFLLAVMDRVALLNGEETMPSVGTVDPSDLDHEKRRANAAQPLPPNLESIVQAYGKARAPQPLPLIPPVFDLFSGEWPFVALIAILWTVLYVGF